MYELNIAVAKVLGTCTAEPPMKPGDYFTVRDGVIRIPEGGYVCMWALHSLLPVITMKERKILEEKDEDWVWRVHHVQCPDPKGRVVFKIEQVGKVGRGDTETRGQGDKETRRHGDTETRGQGGQETSGRGSGGEQGSKGRLKDLRVVVEEVRGKCTSGMRPGDYFVLCSGRLYIPAGDHFCLYALHAALPLLPAKQRSLEDGDWMKEDCHVICPDPAGNVVMRIEALG